MGAYMDSKRLIGQIVKEQGQRREGLTVKKALFFSFLGQQYKDI